MTLTDDQYSAMDNIASNSTSPATKVNTDLSDNDYANMDKVASGQTLQGGVQQNATPGWNNVGNAVQNGIGNIPNTLGQMLQQTGQDIGTTAVNYIKDPYKTVGSTALSALNGAIGTAGNAANGLYNFQGDFQNAYNGNNNIQRQNPYPINTQDFSNMLGNPQLLQNYAIASDKANQQAPIGNTIGQMMATAPLFSGGLGSTALAGAGLGLTTNAPLGQRVGNAVIGGGLPAVTGGLNWSIGKTYPTMGGLMTGINPKDITDMSNREFNNNSIYNSKINPQNKEWNPDEAYSNMYKNMGEELQNHFENIIPQKFRDLSNRMRVAIENHLKMLGEDVGKAHQKELIPSRVRFHGNDLIKIINNEIKQDSKGGVYHPGGEAIKADLINISNEIKNTLKGRANKDAMKSIGSNSTIGKTITAADLHDLLKGFYNKIYERNREGKAGVYLLQAIAHRFNDLLRKEHPETAAANDAFSPYKNLYDSVPQLEIKNGVDNFTSHIKNVSKTIAEDQGKDALLEKLLSHTSSGQDLLKELDNLTLLNKQKGGLFRDISKFNDISTSSKEYNAIKALDDDYTKTTGNPSILDRAKELKQVQNLTKQFGNILNKNIGGNKAITPLLGIETLATLAHHIVPGASEAIPWIAAATSPRVHALGIQGAANFNRLPFNNIANYLSTGNNNYVNANTQQSHHN
jgi:hypothetical protein